MTIDAHGATNPAAGVMHTSPATIPDAAPSALGLPRCFVSATSQPMAPALAATCVVTNASAADWLLASALPALKPNQPNHKRPAPVSVIVRLCGMYLGDG